MTSSCSRAWAGNGDAHLKNFGLLYSDPAAGDARLSPAFDIVCTTAYRPEDGLALSLGGARSLFAARAQLPELAERWEVSNPGQRVARVVDAALAVLVQERQLLSFYPEVHSGIEVAIDAFTRRR